MKNIKSVLTFCFFLSVVALKAQISPIDDNNTDDSTKVRDNNFQISICMESTYEPEFYEYYFTLISTNEEDQIIERTDTSTGEILPNQLICDSYSLFVDEYKLVGVRVTPITKNLQTLTAILSRVSDSTEVLNRTIEIPSTVLITYDFEKGSESITSE
jgi:hypothetical protein